MEHLALQPPSKKVCEERLGLQRGPLVFGPHPSDMPGLGLTNSGVSLNLSETCGWGNWHWVCHRRFGPVKHLAQPEYIFLAHIGLLDPSSIVWEPSRVINLCNTTQADDDFLVLQKARFDQYIQLRLDGSFDGKCGLCFMAPEDMHDDSRCLMIPDVADTQNTPDSTVTLAQHETVHTVVGFNGMLRRECT